LAQQRLNLDAVRSQVRQSVVQAWSQLEAARRQLDAAHVQAAAARAALAGVQQEALVGQRTTFDVLNAQQLVVNARDAEVVAQHDLVVASYALLSAVGRLSPTVLDLPTSTYDPMLHYRQVRDAWFGVRAPNGQVGFAPSGPQQVVANVDTGQSAQAAHPKGQAAVKEASAPQSAQIVSAAWTPPLPPSRPAKTSARLSPDPKASGNKSAARKLPVTTASAVRSAPESNPQSQVAVATQPAPSQTRAPPPSWSRPSEGTPDRFSTENNSGLLSGGSEIGLFSSGSNSGVLSGVQPGVPAAGFQ
jgi:hypothetical protein